MTRDGHVDNNIIVQWIDVTLKKYKFGQEISSATFSCQLFGDDEGK